MRALLFLLTLSGCGLVVGLRADYELGDASVDAGSDSSDVLVQDAVVKDVLDEPCTDMCCNKMMDGMETDTDCGGPTCKKCSTGQKCTQDSDCLSNNCHNNQKTCRP